MLKKRNVLPPLDYLVAFDAAARLGGFARASQHLHLSETAISRKVRLLEQHYGTALFQRGHRSVTLTEQGAALQSSVSRALDILRDASSDLLAEADTRALTLAATNSVSALWLLPRLPQFHRDNDQVRIRLVSSDSDEECLAEQVDLSILRGEGHWPGFEPTMLFGETVFPVCSPRYLEDHPEAADLRAIAGLDLIEVSSRHSEWMNWRTWLEDKGFSDPAIDRAATFNTYPLAVQAAADGLGIGLGWGHLVDRHLDAGTLIRPLGQVSVRTTAGYYLLRRSEKTPFPALETVEAWLRSESESRRRYG